MKEDSLKKMSTLNYIDSWASLDVWEVEDGIDDIIDSADQITDSVEEMEL